MDLSAVVTNFNTAHLLEGCLDSLLQDTARAGLSAEVILVDDASTDGSADLVATRFPSVRLIRHEERRGYAASNNVGMAAARGQYLLLLNSDTQTAAGAVPAMLHAARTHPRTIVAPRLLNPDGTPQHSAWRFPLTWLIGNTLFLFRLGLWHDYTEMAAGTRAVDWASSAAWLVSRSAASQVGPFDEGFGLYGVDVDWAYRARRQGFRFLFLSEASIAHFGRASWAGQRDPLVADHLAGHMRFFRKHYGTLGATLYRVLVFVNSAARAVVWSIPFALGNKRGGHKVRHFLRMLRWSIAPAGGPADH